jgi:hypothetical protein
MRFEDATVEVPKLNVPAELVAEVARRNKNKRQTDFRVDALKPSLLERLARMLGLA